MDVHVHALPQVHVLGLVLVSTCVRLVGVLDTQLDGDTVGIHVDGVSQGRKVCVGKQPPPPHTSKGLVHLQCSEQCNEAGTIKGELLCLAQGGI